MNAPLREFGGLRLAPRPRYVSIAQAGLREALAYRGSAILELFSGLVWVGVLYYIWDAVYAGHMRIEGYSWAEMRTYILVAYAVNALLAFQTAIRMNQVIRTGQIASELTRPVDYLAASFARAGGRAVIEGLLVGCLALVLGVLLFDVDGPNSPLALVFFGPAVVLGFVVKFLIHYMVALLTFVTTNSAGLIWAETALVNLFSGALIPLAFFPDWLQRILAFLPFQGIVNVPVGIYLGRLDGADLVAGLGSQLAWIVVLVLIAKLAWRPAVRALDIQGG